MTSLWIGSGVLAVAGLLAIGVWLLLQQRRLREQARIYRSVVAQSTTGMALYGGAGKWQQANPEFLALIGLDDTSLQGRELVSLVHPDDAAAFPASLDGASLPFAGELRLTPRDGEPLWTRWHITRVAAGIHLVQIVSIQQAREAALRLESNRHRLELALSAGGVGTWQYSIASGELHWDGKMYELYCAPDRDKGDLTLNKWRERVHPEDIDQANAAFQSVIEGGGDMDAEFRICVPGQHDRHIRSRAVKVVPGGSDTAMILGTNWDITAEKHLQGSLAREKEQLRVTLDAIADAVIVTDRDGRVTFMNPVAESLTGWRQAQATGKPIDSVLVLLNPGLGEAVRSPVSVALSGGDICFQREGNVLQGRDGSCYDIQDSAAPLKDGKGNVLGAVMVFRDVTTRLAMQKKLRYHATHDSLTGLTNRREFENILQLTLDEVPAEQAMLCFIDLDRFKVVNDTAGHIAGDALLKECAQVIARGIREVDVLARLGGDEFGLLLRNCPAEKAVGIAEQLTEALDDMRFVWNDSVYDIGASVGLVELNETINTVEDAMSRADVACYAAKHRGRGQVSVYTPDDSEASRRHSELQMAASLRESLEADRFQLFAQEIRPVANSDECGHFEILLRLRDRDGEMVSPGAFIPAAERYQMMPQIDRWVVRRLLEHLGPELGAYPDLNLAINLSATSLDDAAFIPFLEQLLADSPLPPHRLTFEITETTVVNQLSSASEVLERLREQGCKVALDDFGSGFSSFSYLKHFPVDFLKIDGAFVRNLMSSSVDHTIVESINEVAHRLGVKTVAEYVEEPGLIPVLEKAGVDFLQGYAIGRPEPLDNLLERLRESQRS